MSRLACLLIALACSCISLCLLVYSLSSPRWMSACLSLASVVMMRKDGSPHAASFPDANHQSEEMPPLDSESLLMNQQLMEEKNWLFDKLKSKKLCFTRGFFSYCLKGDGFFQLGDYQLCISTIGPNAKSHSSWTRTEKTTIHAIFLSGIISCLSIATLSWSIYSHYHRGSTRASEILLRLTTMLSFVAGTCIILGLFPIAVQALSYSSNRTNYYNDMVQGLGAAYFVEMKVNWAIKDGDMTDAQAWARNIVNHMAELGLDRDFFLTLTSGVFLYIACAALLARSKHEQNYLPLHKHS